MYDHVQKLVEKYSHALYEHYVPRGILIAYYRVTVFSVQELS